MPNQAVSKEFARRFEYFGRSYREFDPAAQRLFLTFLKTSVLFKGMLGRRLSSYGLTGQAFGLLIMLESLPDKCLPMNQISQRLWVTKANVTGLVDTLEKKRLVVRQPSRRDRRVIQVGLTPEGRKKLKSILPGHFTFVRNLFDAFTSSDKDRFVRFLETFSARLV